MNMLIKKVLFLSNFSHTDIDCQIQHYNTKLKNILNEIAAATTKIITVRPHIYIWYNKDLRKCAENMKENGVNQV